MPPFVSAECANQECKHINRFDLAELRKDNAYAYKGKDYREAGEDEEFYVTCGKCGQPFKFAVKGGQNAK